MKTINVDENLKAIADYFKNCLLNGEFEFLKCGDHVAEVKINDKYHILIWTSNDPKNYCEIYFSLDNFLNQCSHFKFNTQKERLKVWKNLKPYLIDYKNEVLKKEKEDQIERLKKQIEYINLKH